MDCPEFRILAKGMTASKYILNLRQPGMTFWNSCSIPLSPGSECLWAIGQRLVTQGSCRNSVPKSWGQKQMPEGKKGARGREKCPCHMQGCVMHELQNSWNPGPHGGATGRASPDRWRGGSWGDGWQEGGRYTVQHRQMMCDD